MAIWHFEYGWSIVSHHWNMWKVIFIHLSPSVTSCLPFFWHWHAGCWVPSGIRGTWRTHKEKSSSSAVAWREASFFYFLLLFCSISLTLFPSAKLLEVRGDFFSTTPSWMCTVLGDVLLLHIYFLWLLKNEPIGWFRYHIALCIKHVLPACVRSFQVFKAVQ